MLQLKYCENQPQQTYQTEFNLILKNLKYKVFVLIKGGTKILVGGSIQKHGNLWLKRMTKQNVPKSNLSYGLHDKCRSRPSKPRRTIFRANDLFNSTTKLQQVNNIYMRAYIFHYQGPISLCNYVVEWTKPIIFFIAVIRF